VTTAIAHSETPTGRRLTAKRGLAARLRYYGGKRDLRLDLLRGFAVFAMVVDHASQRSWLAYLTGADRYFVSAAEPFVFISGLVLGMVYRPLFQKSGLWACIRKALGRAVTLYFVTVVFGLLFIGLSAYFGAWWGPERAELTNDYVLRIATFRRTFYLVDIPMLYTLLLLLAVPALVLLSLRLTPVVLLASWALWLAWQLSWQSVPVPWLIEGNTTFELPTWQVLFFTGLAIGWHRRLIERLLAEIPRPARSAMLVLMIGGALALFAAQRVLIPTFTFPEDARDSWYLLIKPLVPISRLLAFAAFLGGAYALLTLAWRPIVTLTGWLLLPLGQNALTAYALHLFTALGAALYLGEFGYETAPMLEILIAQLTCLVLIWSVILIDGYIRQRLQDDARIRRRAGTPRVVRYAA
jgi:hypothetical protein